MGHWCEAFWLYPDRKEACCGVGHGGAGAGSGVVVAGRWDGWSVPGLVGLVGLVVLGCGWWRAGGGSGWPDLRGFAKGGEGA